MAPPPEYDKEPKAPDKNSPTVANEEIKVHTLVNDVPTFSDHKTANSTSNIEVENNKHVESLDDGQLRALLDEAIQYKCPKDREGKSSLFKELLEEVEHQDEVSEAASRGFIARGGPHANSLQDLMAALKVESTSRPVRHQPPPHSQTSVSARAIHGGSLPSGVDTSFMLAEEPTRGGYLATVRCVNPPPLAERRVSASDANTPQEMELLNKRSKPMFPMYTARASLEIGSGSVSSGRAVTTTTPSNQVDSTIPFSCITTPEVVASCNTISSSAQSAVAIDPKPRSVISSTFNGLPLSRPNYGATGAVASSDEYKVPIFTVHYRLQKSLDENGNAVQGIGSPVSGSSQHKKPRRKKSSKNETVIKSHQIDGYQGNKDLNEVLRFIESNADAGRGGKLRGKHKDDDDKGKKRSTERRKAQEKVKRASSLEELSRTKLEDLTDAPEPPPAKPERRSWGDDARDGFYFRAADAEPAPDQDFQTVTKRRKPRRERAERDERPERDPRRARPPEPRARRESAPPSDRSNDSNDDMDSVHSLPAPPRAPLAAPHASYADIARTRHNIPDLIESCNFYAEGAGGGDSKRAEPAPQPADADGYPALEPRVAARRAKPPAPGAARRERKERAAAAPAECPAPDVVSDRRPPVILLDAQAQARDMDGVTFGFDINETLLAGARPRCDLVAGADAGRAVAVSAGCAALRFLLPDPPPDTHHLHQIIDYVGSAWEDVIRCGSGKVRYFSE
ncbi:uncharacterized protein LOC106141972 isoform X3 [Amyelois transitella]|uniref:uncharacterized protein LOC106141972 isoform X3 n=1 Tax=Amyelois transitella TaxID=680683 RepID=UPI00298F59A8|nr:uncharacterized protein LOC106141972 isoform X3 [Amyelois transitella]